MTSRVTPRVGNTDTSICLSREGELVISTNTDPKDSSEGAGDGFWRQFGAPGSADWYRPFFFRIFKWERAFDN